MGVWGAPLAPHQKKMRVYALNYAEQQVTTSMKPSQNKRGQVKNCASVVRTNHGNAPKAQAVEKT
jgi:hypothetical protein